MGGVATKVFAGHRDDPFIFCYYKYFFFRGIDIERMRLWVCVWERKSVCVRSLSQSCLCARTRVWTPRLCLCLSTSLYMYLHFRHCVYLSLYRNSALYSIVITSKNHYAFMSPKSLVSTTRLAEHLFHTRRGSSSLANSEIDCGPEVAESKPAWSYPRNFSFSQVLPRWDVFMIFKVKDEGMLFHMSCPLSLRIIADSPDGATYKRHIIYGWK